MIKYLFVRIFRNEGVKWKKQWKQIREIMKENVYQKRTESAGYPLVWCGLLSGLTCLECLWGLHYRRGWRFGRLSMQ